MILTIIFMARFRNRSTKKGIRPLANQKILARFLMEASGGCFSKMHRFIELQSHRFDASVNESGVQKTLRRHLEGDYQQIAAVCDELWAY